jgi:hypothetical protein
MDEENLGHRNKTRDASMSTIGTPAGTSSSFSSITTAHPVNDIDDTKTPVHEKTRYEKWRPWLMWWNTEEWMACWIGFILFGAVTGAVLKGIPSPVFEQWQHNPFMTFANVGNYGLIVLFFVMGGLLWLAMALYKPTHWKVFPIGYVVVFFVALISNMLASNGKIRITMEGYTKYYGI